MVEFTYLKNNYGLFESEYQEAIFWDRNWKNLKNHLRNI